MSWSWEYIPSEEYVTSGAPADFLKAVEEKAGELARAAEALFASAGRGWSALAVPEHV